MKKEQYLMLVILMLLFADSFRTAGRAYVSSIRLIVSRRGRLEWGRWCKSRINLVGSNWTIRYCADIGRAIRN